MGAVSFSVDRGLLEGLKAALPLEVFVETGTFEGDSALVAAALFPRVHTIELSEAFAERARARLRHLPGVEVHQGRSAEVLRALRSGLAGRAVVYWLDAHWSGTDDADGVGAPCPLLEELEALGSLNAESVVLIDDARLFLAPSPQLDEQWPDVHTVFQRLIGLSTFHRLVVVNDVIVFCPPAAWASVRCYAREHGVEWSQVYRQALERERLRAELLAKDRTIRYWWDIASRAWTRRMRSTAKAAAWTARDYLPRPVIEGIKGVLPGRMAKNVRVLLDGASGAGGSIAGAGGGGPAGTSQIETVVPLRPLPGPALFHVTHWKAGSQWVYAILNGCVPDAIVRPRGNMSQVLEQPVQEGLVYPTLYLERQEFERIELPDQSRVFVVIRDMRDTLVSLYFSWKISHPEMSPGITINRAALNRLGLEDGLLYLVSHVYAAKIARIQESWIGSGYPIVRYEELLEDDVSSFERLLLEHGKLAIPRRRLRRAVEASRFERMTGGRERGQELQSSHHRKGVAGDWRSYFTPRVTREFKARFADVLIATGYERDRAWGTE
jgi:lipopolysaccharide transport system ATP-binding protein